ncbi:MAG: hypothetical protein J0H59_16245 [Comamonadaceae bacterium]|nr:hypothetical protein [Comamonadaceae bacterium]
MRSGIAISLKYQHDHIEDAVLVYTSQDCAVYLLVESGAIKPSFVKLLFEGARSVRSARTNCSPAIGIYPEQGTSFIVELTDSQWPIEAHKAYTYAGSPLKPRGRHYVVSNHDVFHEILADSFSEELITQGDYEYEFIEKHFV